MKTEVKKHFVNIMLPSVVLSLIVGVITGMIVFAFRVITEHIIELSHAIYTFAGEHPFAIAPIVAGAVLMAFLVSLCLVYSPHSRGGGIPTAVALMRGLITFHWLRNIIFVFTSALFSYLCGIPLGNDEGPAVQMGTAIGSGTSRLTHHRGWERYLMTAGATAGFATVTCAPIAAVMFGLEEAHRRITPLLLMSSITSVLSGMATLRFFCFVTGRSDLTSLFHFQLTAVLPLGELWIAMLVGVLCGIGAYLFAKLTLKMRAALHKKLKDVHPFFKVAPVFVLVVIVGCFFYEAIGTGHHLIETLVAHRTAWYLSLAVLLVRAVLVILSNNAGVTGGLFTPILVFGALIGSMTAEALIAIGVLEEAYFPLLVVIGMSSFFSASVRTPLTAAIFAVEVFSGLPNLLAIFVSILFSYIIVEVIGVTSINEIAMEREIHREHMGKQRKTVDVLLTAKPGSFAIGKEPRDILWPAFCHVLSVLEDDKDERDSYEGGVIHAHNILRLNFTTYDPDATAEELCAILGDQPVYENAHIETDADGMKLSEQLSRRGRNVPSKS